MRYIFSAGPPGHQWVYERFMRLRGDVPECKVLGMPNTTTPRGEIHSGSVDAPYLHISQQCVLEAALRLGWNVQVDCPDRDGLAVSMWRDDGPNSMDLHDVVVHRCLHGVGVMAPAAMDYQSILALALNLRVEGWAP